MASLFPVRWKLKVLGLLCKIPTKSINASFISGAEEVPPAIMLMKVCMNKSSVSPTVGSRLSLHSDRRLNISADSWDWIRNSV